MSPSSCSCGCGATKASVQTTTTTTTTTTALGFSYTPGVIPSGYRELNAGEKILATDLRDSFGDGSWELRLSTSYFIGQAYDVEKTHDRTIRKVEATQPAAPVELKYVEGQIPPGYRKLNDGETIAAGDLFAPYCGSWKTNVLVGRMYAIGAYKLTIRPIPKANPGEGYRLLNWDETILPTDERSYPNWAGQTARWIPDPSSNVGDKVADAVSTRDTSNTGYRVFRRKVALAPVAKVVEPAVKKPQAIVPGDGYRLLSSYETIQENDDWFYPNFDREEWWTGPSDSVGRTVTAARRQSDKPTDPFYRVFRRKVEPVTPAPVVEAKKTSTVDIPAGYRELPEGEILRGDDLVRDDYGAWVLRSSNRAASLPKGTGTPYNRTRPAYRHGLTVRVNAIPFAGKGYRLLEKAETIVSTDEAFSNYTTGLSNWSRANNYAAGQPVQYDLDHPTAFKYRRLLVQPAVAKAAPAPAPTLAELVGPVSDGTANVPAGWRELNDGEVCRSTDFYLLYSAPKWVPATSVGRKYVRGTWLKTIRKLRVPTGTPPAGYRFLIEGEVVQKGDSFTTRSGNLVECNACVGSRVGSDALGGEISYTTEPFLRPLPTPVAPPTPVVSPEKKYVVKLELSREDADALYHLGGSIGGDPRTTARHLFDSIRMELLNQGLVATLGFGSHTINGDGKTPGEGSVYFYPAK